MNRAVPSGNLCNSSDHAGIVAQINLPKNSQLSEPLPDHAPFPISFWNWVGIAMIGIPTAIIYARRRRKK